MSTISLTTLTDVLKQTAEDAKNILQTPTYKAHMDVYTKVWNVVSGLFQAGVTIDAILETVETTLGDIELNDEREWNMYKHLLRYINKVVKKLNVDVSRYPLYSQKIFF